VRQEGFKAMAKTIDMGKAISEAGRIADQSSRLLMNNEPGNIQYASYQKPETYILCFPNGNMAAIRRESFIEAIEQVLARQDEIAANHKKFSENL
jgi:hypothetical protein